MKYKFFYFVGVPRFELGTSCSQSRRTNRAVLHPECCSFRFCDCKVRVFIWIVQIFQCKNLYYFLYDNDFQCIMRRDFFEVHAWESAGIDNWTFSIRGEVKRGA